MATRCRPRDAPANSAGMTAQPTSAPTADQPPGQATFEMANLRPKTTGLPFIVFISQRGSAQHDVRLKVSPAPRVQIDQMGTYALRPFRHEGGPRLSTPDERQLQLWATVNEAVLVAYSNAGDIAYTEEAIEQLVPV